jgi:hypothetical protein
MWGVTVWMIWIQGDDATWLQAAWDDELIGENNAGWQEEVEKARKLAFDNNYEMRIQKVNIPGVFELFAIPSVTASEA